MTSTKTLALICGMLLAASTGVMAGGKSGATSTGYQSGMQQTGQHMSDQNIAATVQEIDQQDNKVTLQFQDGNSVELKVSPQMMNDLEKGDSVNVSIQKSGQSGMGTQPGQTGGMTKPKSQ